INDYVSAPATPSLDIRNALTIDAWINPSQFGAATTVIAGRPSSYQLDLLANGHVRFAYPFGGSVSQFFDSATVMPLNQWTHVAGVFDGQTIFVYVNGVLQSLTGRAGPIDSQTKPFQIGGFNHPGGFVGGFFTGAIDEVELFDRALSAEEVSAIFQAGAAGKCKCDPEPTGLVSWLPGNGDANDIRGGAVGQVQGATFAAGKVGQGFRFNGSGLISLPHSNVLNLTTVTLDAWISLGSLPGAAADYVVATKSISSTSENYGLYITNVGGSAELRFEWYNAGFHSVTTIGSGLPVGGFHHVAVTVDGSTIRFYVDGRLVGSEAQPAPLVPATGALQIGSAEPSFGNRFDGVIDELHVFNRALDATEIGAIVAAGTAGVCANRPPVATSDAVTTISGAPVSIAPSANDIDPDVAFPSALATVRVLPPGVPQLTFPSETVVVAATGLAYFGGGNVSIGTPGQVGILDTSTNTITGVIPLPVPGNLNLGRANQTTKIVYFRGFGGVLTAI